MPRQKKEWRVYLGDQASTHFSPLTQINKQNVTQFQVAWTYRTGDLPEGGYATPSTYEYQGKQCVVIACGGGKMGTKPGDAYVAFALPE